MDTATTDTHIQSSNATRTILVSILRAYLTFAVPILLVLTSARLVMTPQFLEFEYNRPDFPDDVYGFTREDRLYYAPFAIEYLLTDAGINLLADLTFADGAPLFSQRELDHMADVKTVTYYAFLTLAGGTLSTVAVGFSLWKNPSSRTDLRQGLLHGSILTLSLIGVIVVLAVTAWDVFFTAFHNMFFESGTWRFAYSDTLIRLFPERFWFDAALAMGLLTSLGAIVILAFTRQRSNSV